MKNYISMNYSTVITVGIKHGSTVCIYALKMKHCSSCMYSLMRVSCARAHFALYEYYGWYALPVFFVVDFKFRGLGSGAGLPEP